MNMSHKPIELIEEGIRGIAYEENEDRIEHLTKMIINAFNKFEKRLEALERDVAQIKNHLRIS